MMRGYRMVMNDNTDIVSVIQGVTPYTIIFFTQVQDFEFNTGGGSYLNWH